MGSHNVNQLIAFGALENQPCGQLNLTPGAHGGEYSAGIVGEITRCVSEDGVSVSSQRKRALGITRDCKIRMIEQIVGFRSHRDLRAFRQLENLLERQIKLGERGATQDIAPSIAELTWRRHGKRTRIKPA
jgi:hypothetical protein